MNQLSSLDKSKNPTFLFFCLGEFISVSSTSFDDEDDVLDDCDDPGRKLKGLKNIALFLGSSMASSLFCVVLMLMLLLMLLVFLFPVYDFPVFVFLARFLGFVR